MVAATFTPLFGIPMGPEVIVILLIAILLFGANKIPKLARSTGEAMGEFQKGREKVEKELEQMRGGEFESNDDLVEGGETGFEGEAAPADATDTTGEAETTDAVETETETEEQ